MKKKLLIATHSVFADGIKNAMELVTDRGRNSYQRNY